MSMHIDVRLGGFQLYDEVTFYERMIDVTIAADWQQAMPNAQCGLKSTNSFALYNSGCGNTWDLTLVKGFNRGRKDVKKTLL